MRKESFEEFLKKITQYYGKEGTISPERVDQWFDRVTNIPAEACEFIKGEIFDSEKHMPPNLPKRMKELYREYVRQNPQKFIKESADRCEPCGSTGFLWYRDPNDRFYREIMAICADCDNWKLSMGVNCKNKHATRLKSDLIEQGMKVKEVKNYDGDDNTPASWLMMKSYNIGEKI